MSSDFSFFGLDFIGERANQEDYFSFSQARGGLLAVLSDGMGGHRAGEVASRLAVQSFVTSFVELNSQAIANSLGISLERANGEVGKEAARDSSRSGMGCTLVAVYVGDEGLNWVSVGDSILLLIRGARIRRLNADHSMMPIIEASLREGRITYEEAATHPQRNALRSALTGDRLTLIDLPSNPTSLIAGDCLILASDGLATLSESEILSVVNQTLSLGASEVAKGLIEAVKTKRLHKQDNTTVQVVCLHSDKGTVLGRASRKLTFRVALIIFLIVPLLSVFWLAERFNLFPSVAPKFQATEAPRPSPVPVPAPQGSSVSDAAPQPDSSAATQDRKRQPKAAEETRNPVKEQRIQSDKEKKFDGRKKEGVRGFEPQANGAAQTTSPADSVRPGAQDGKSIPVAPKDGTEPGRETKSAGDQPLSTDRSSREPRAAEPSSAQDSGGN